MRRLLIATWGSPAEWFELDYTLYEEETLLWQGSSCTTLVPMLEGLCTENCDAVVVALDSLVDLGPPRTRGVPGEESACYICSESCRHLLKDLPGSYAELREVVRRFVEEVVRCLGVKARVRVVVAPAVGSPGGVWRFSGRAEDFESVVLYEVGSMALSERYDRVILDLTHGINFMPSLTLRLAYRLASILLVAHEGLVERGVELRVYNSDPFRRRRPEGQGRVPVNINLIARDLVKSIQLIHEVPRPLRRLQRLSGELGERVSRLNSEACGVMELAYPALYYPLPLALCAAVAESGSPLAIVEEALKLWLSSVEVSGTTVRRTLSINPDAVYALLLLEAAARRLKEVEYPTPLADLQRLADLYSSVHRSYYHLVSNEVGLLKEVAERVGAGGWIRYCEMHRDGCRETERPDARIMVAHAGLQKEFVEIGPPGQLRYVYDVSRILRDSGLAFRCRD